jgi:hypothetical protein
MLLRHATPARNLRSILRHGLLTSKSQGKLKVVWTHTASMSDWAAIHTVKRHGGRVEDVVVFELSIPPQWLRRARTGLWYCVRDIPPERMRRLIGFAELAGQSAA